MLFKLVSVMVDFSVFHSLLNTSYCTIVTWLQEICPIGTTLLGNTYPSPMPFGQYGIKEVINTQSNMQ
jgi:hypothetical protein